MTQADQASAAAGQGLAGRGVVADELAALGLQLPLLVGRELSFVLLAENNSVDGDLALQLLAFASECLQACFSIAAIEAHQQIADFHADALFHGHCFNQTIHGGLDVLHRPGWL